MRPAAAFLAALAVSSCGAESPARGPIQEGAVTEGAARGGAAEAMPGEPPRSAGAAAELADVAGFTDVTESFGIDYVHDAGFSADKHLPETMGGGAVIFDAEGDGDFDLYFVQSGPMPVGAAAARTEAMPPNQLYRNAGGRFADDPDIGAGAHRGYGQGAAAGDVDGDGDADLYVTNFGPDVLLSNDGGGRFADRTAGAGLGDGRWTAGCLLFDAEADGDLDLYVTGYVAIDVDHPAWCGRREPGWRSYCHPDHYEGLADRFWRNRGDGTFREATREAGLADGAGKGLGAIAGDWDGDGDLDLYVANDSVENRFWRNRGDGTFADDTLLSGTGVNGRGATEAGMGLASGDVDGDLDLDLFVTNFDEESNTLYRNDGGGLFTDATALLGLDAASRLPVGFGTVLEDFDADGDLDLAVANGHIIDNIELYHDGKSWAQRALFFVNDGERFRPAPERAAPLTREPFVGRGLYGGDLDGDGDADLVLVQCGGPARVFRNDARGDGLLVLRGLPRGTQVTARLAEGRALLREAGPQPSYYGQGDGLVRLGLGAGELAGLVIRVPGEEPVELSGAGLPAGAGEFRCRRGPDGWSLRAE